jgi:hypothetical protein
MHPIVYLDLNHWISLAKAATGHRDGSRFGEALDALRQSLDRIVVPLGSVTSWRWRGPGIRISGVMSPT